MKLVFHSSIKCMYFTVYYNTLGRPHKCEDEIVKKAITVIVQCSDNF